MDDRSLIEQAERSLENGDSAAAIGFAEQALERRDSVAARLLLAEALADSGSPDRARRCLDTGLHLFPDDFDLLLALGDLDLEQLRGTDAQKRYLRVLELDDTQADAWGSLAVAQLHLEQLDEAESSARRALDCDPEAVFVLTLLGEICLRRGRTEEAEALLQQALVLDPEDPQPSLSLAELYYESGDPIRAEKHCRKALEKDAGLAEAYLTLGYVCLDQDRHSDAGDAFRQFLRLEKDPAAEALRNEVAAVLEGLN